MNRLKEDLTVRDYVVELTRLRIPKMQDTWKRRHFP